MILYFSGTGNSEYVAKRISKMIQDEVMNLFDKCKEKDNAKVTSTMTQHMHGEYHVLSIRGSGKQSSQEIRIFIL